MPLSDETTTDPYLDLAALDLGLGAIGDGLALTVGPAWPAGVPKPPRPKVAEVLEQAEREREDHAGRLEQAREAHLRLNGHLIGYFPRHKKLIASGEMDLAPLTDLRDETDLANTSIAQMTVCYEDPYRNILHKEEAKAKEDACHFQLECTRRAHARMFGGSFDVAITDDFQKNGMAVVFTGVSPDNQETGIDTRLVDPNTVFPIFEDELKIGRAHV